MASLHEAADTKTNCGAWHFFGKNNLRKERTFSIRKPNDPTCCPSVFPLHFAPTFCHYISPLRVAATFHLYVLPLHFTPTFCHYISPLLFATTFAPTPLRLPLYLLRHCSTRQRIFAAERRWHSGFLTVMVWFRTEVWQQCSLEQMAKNEHWGFTKQSTVLLAREWRGYFSLLFYLFCSVDIALYRVTSSLPHATRETSNIHRSNKEHTTVCPKDTLLFVQRTHYCLSSDTFLQCSDGNRLSWSRENMWLLRNSFQKRGLLSEVQNKQQHFQNEMAALPHSNRHVVEHQPAFHRFLFRGYSFGERSGARWQSREVSGTFLPPRNRYAAGFVTTATVAKMRGTYWAEAGASKERVGSKKYCVSLQEKRRNPNNGHVGRLAVPKPGINQGHGFANECVTHPAELAQLGDHDYDVTTLLPYHAPEVAESVLLWSLCGDELSVFFVALRRKRTKR